MRPTRMTHPLQELDVADAANIQNQIKPSLSITQATPVRARQPHCPVPPPLRPNRSSAPA